MSKVKRRIDWIDVLRGFGILFMIMGHVGFGELSDTYIHAFHMPLFFTVSGFFFRPEKQDGYLRYLLHDLKTILLPYTVFFLLYQPLHYLYTRTFDWQYMLLSFISSNRNRVDVSGALWFLLCFFVCRQIFYFVMRLPRWFGAAAVTALTLFGNLIWFHPWFCLDSALSCLGAMYVGFVLAHTGVKRLRRWYCAPWWLVLAAFAVNIALIFVNGPVNVRTNSYGFVPLFWLNCLTGIFCWANVSFWLTRIANPIVRWLTGFLRFTGKYSVIYLVTNELLIGVFFILGRSLPVAQLPWVLPWKTAVLLLTLAGITLLAFLARRTPLRLIFGIHKNK